MYYQVYGENYDLKKNSRKPIRISEDFQRRHRRKVYRKRISNISIIDVCGSREDIKQCSLSKLI